MNELILEYRDLLESPAFRKREQADRKANEALWLSGERRMEHLGSFGSYITRRALEEDLSEELYEILLKEISGVDKIDVSAICSIAAICVALDKEEDWEDLLDLCDDNIEVDIKFSHRNPKDSPPYEIIVFLILILVVILIAF